MPTFIKVFLLTLCLTQPVYAGKGIVFSLLSLDQVTRKVINNKSKVLSVRTEIIAGKKVHIIKILTKDGRVQYIKVDAQSGKRIR